MAIALALIFLGIAAFYAFDVTVHEEELEGIVLRWTKEQHETGTRLTVAFVELSNGITVSAIVGRGHPPPAAGRRVKLVKRETAFGRTKYVLR